MARGAGGEVELNRQRRIRPVRGRRPTRHVKKRGESAGRAGQHVDHLRLRGEESLSVQRGEHGAQVEPNLARLRGAVDEGIASRDDLRTGRPEFGGHVEVFERGEIAHEEVGIKGAQARRAGKVRGVRDGEAALAEAREEAHRARPQAVGGVEREGGRLAGDGVEFPDVIVEIVRAAEAKVGGKC